jgi:flagellar biosynthesis activator protein FlaF
MYKMSYAEIMEGSARTQRDSERAALDRAIALMTAAEAKAAEAKDANSSEVTDAVAYVQKLWTFFIENLSDPRNELNDELKRDLIAIGVWAVAESDRVLADPSTSFSALIDVNKMIRDGLA